MNYILLESPFLFSTQFIQDFLKGPEMNHHHFIRHQAMFHFKGSLKFMNVPKNIRLAGRRK